MTTDERYNGWANYETWAVKLWIDNERSDYEFWREETQRIMANPTYENEFMTLDRRIVNELAEALKESFEEANPCQDANVFADLMNASLRSVEWIEIAESMIESEKENAEYEAKS